MVFRKITIKLLNILKKKNQKKKGKKPLHWAKVTKEERDSNRSDRDVAVVFRRYVL